MAGLCGSLAQRERRPPENPQTEQEQTVRKLPFIVTRGEAGQDEDDKILVTPDRQLCG